MNNKTGAVLIGGILSLGGCAREPEISFKNDVIPILSENCQSCHVQTGPGYIKSGLSMESYEDLMKGTRYGPVIVPGDSLVSTLNMMVEGRVDKSIRMPHGERPLTDQEIETLKLWVNQGAKNN